MKRLTLRQTFEQPVHGALASGPYKTFDWAIQSSGYSNYTKVGSWEANYWFHVKTGATEKETLGNARRSLARKARLSGEKCSFEYIGE